MKYALLDYNYSTNGYVNFGDQIQSLAARQYLPRVDYFLDREKINEKCEPAKVIMNGWFMHLPTNWPPHRNIQPLFTSFHLNPKAYEMLRVKENIKYFKKHEPIGCRDYRTQEMLSSYGIKSYYSFCLTSTLGIKYKSLIRDESIIFNDVFYRYLPIKYKRSHYGLIKRVKAELKNIKNYPSISKKEKLEHDYFPNNIIKKTIRIHQNIPVSIKSEDKFKYAEDIIRKYARAKLVVTSRIHCAIPCLALETPVLFLLDGVEDYDRDISRFNGILDHVNILTKKSKKEVNKIFGKEMKIIHPEDVDWDNPPTNPNTHLELSDQLVKRCKSFVY